MDPLYICNQDYEHCLNCGGCPCKYPHTVDDCVGKYLGCDCLMIDEFAYQENEREWDECHPVLIMDEMPQLWGDLEHPMVSMLLKKFSQKPKNLFPVFPNPDKKIKFRRYNEIVYPTT